LALQRNLNIIKTHIIVCSRKLRNERDTMSENKEDKQKKDNHLELKDYLAFIIASMQTTLLPILILIIVLLLLVVFIHP